MTDRKSARESWVFTDDDHVLIDRYIITWPVGQGIVLDVPVPYHPDGENKKVERQLRVQVNNIIIRAGKQGGRKGRPNLTKERTTQHINDIPMASWEDRP